MGDVVDVLDKMAIRSKRKDPGGLAGPRGVANLRKQVDMANRTVRPPAAEERNSLPPDIETMRATARRLLADDAEPPSPEELETLTLLLRGHLMVAIPAVEIAAGRLPKDDVPRACAMACIGEARMRLRLEPGRTLPAGIAHAQRLARSVDALADHYENIGGHQ